MGKFGRHFSLPRNVVFTLALVCAIIFLPFTTWADFNCQLPAAANPQLDSLIFNLDQTCQSLRFLCINSPSHPNCRNNPDGPDMGSPREIQNLQNQFDDNIESVSADVFQEVDHKLSDLKITKLTPEERSNYEMRMTYIGELSGSKLPYHKAMAERLYYSLSAEWIRLYGNPFQKLEISVDETGQVLPFSRKYERDYVKDQGALVVPYLALMILNIGAKPAGAASNAILSGTRCGSKLKSVFQNTWLLSAMFRTRLNMESISSVLATLPIGALGYNRIFDDNKYLTAADVVVPPPAHFMLFGYENNFSTEDLDPQSSWSKKYFELLLDSANTATVQATQLFLGHVSQRLGETGHFKLPIIKDLLSVSKSRTLLKGMRLTPTSIVVGVLAGEIIEQLLNTWTENELLNKMFNAAKSKSQFKFNKTLMSFNQHYLPNAPAVRIIIKTLDDLARFPSYSPQTTLDTIAPIKNSITEYMTPNYTLDSGSYILGNAICRAIAALPAAESLVKLKPEELQKARQDEIAKRRGYAYLYYRFIKNKLQEFTENHDLYKLRGQKISQDFTAYGYDKARDMLVVRMSYYEQLRKKVDHTLISLSKDFYSENRNFSEIQGAMTRIIETEWRLKNTNIESEYNCRDLTVLCEGPFCGNT